MNYITVKLTESQTRTLIEVVGETVIYRRANISPASAAFAERIHQTLIRAYNKDVLKS